MEAEELREKHDCVLRRFNRSKTRINLNSNSNQTKDQKSNEDQSKRWLPHEIWNKMSIYQ